MEKYSITQQTKKMEKLIALQNFADKFNLEVKTISYNDKRKADKYILMQNGTKISPEMTYNDSNMFLIGYNRGYEKKIALLKRFNI